MKRHPIIIITLLFIVKSLAAQHPGQWQLHLATYNTQRIAEAANRVYAMADGTLYSYGKDDNSLVIHSKQNGLSDSDISMIDYHPDTKTLLIVYGNGNIDLINESGLHNLPFLKTATNIPNKTVNNISFGGENAYLSTAFGVVVINMNKREIAETYKLNAETYDVCIRQGAIYAATADGLRKASLSDNLLDAHNWQTVALQTTEFDVAKTRRLCLFHDMVCFWVQGSGVFYMGAEEHPQALSRNTSLRGMRLQADRLILHSASTLYVYESFAQHETFNAGTVNDVASLRNDGHYWIAAGLKGLIGIRRTADNQFEIVVAGLNLKGPKRNLAAFMTMHGQKLLIAGGGRWTDRLWNPGTLMIYENGKWTNLDEDAVNQKVGYACGDYTGVAVDPNDENHYFVSTYGEGVLEIKDNQYVQLYNHANTNALQSIVPGDKNYIRVGGVSFDKSGNLWMTNCEVERGIVVRTADGMWKSLHYQGVGNSSYLVDKILITSKGHKWVNVARSKDRPGILVFDDRETPADASDDVSHFFSSFKSGTGSAIESSVYYCMAEDLKGEIWLGTDRGPIYSSTPQRAIENPDNLFFNRIVRSDADGTNYYFLSGEQINAIAVDGGNRKWLGTASSGIFLVSADGQETIHQFTTDNSPLYSNTIQSIAVDHRTGEVFIGTDKGLISFRGEATQASPDYSDVYAYPNLIRPAVDGHVIVTGLMGESNVKITDLNGNLIYQGKSAGGQFAWNCRNRNGQFVASGIYLVLASTSGAAESVVAKIAVVN